MDVSSCAAKGAQNQRAVTEPPSLCFKPEMKASRLRGHTLPALRNSLREEGIDRAILGP
jgi:hypothetical protein